MPWQGDGTRRSEVEGEHRRGGVVEGGMGNYLNSEVGMRPPAHRGHRGLRPGGKSECGMEKQMKEDRGQMTEEGIEQRSLCAI